MDEWNLYLGQYCPWFKLNKLFEILTFCVQRFNSGLYNMPLEDFEVREALGKGSFGSVSKCVRKTDQEVYAIKQIKIQKLKEKDKQNAVNQIRFLASISSPYVVGYKEAFYDQKSQNLCIIMEYADGGDLQGKIKKATVTKVRISESQIWKTACQLLEGLGTLHQANILHRDIKPANIFFHSGVAKIGDLNIAKHLLDQFTTTQTGTPYYASPEVWNEEPYGFKCDIWSLGCVLYEMAMLKPPFRADNPNNLFKKIMIGQYERIGQPYSKELSNFISKLMTHNQKLRPDVKQMLCYPKIMDLKEEIDEDEENQLIRTIKFPQNLKGLNDKLPKANYESKNKTMKDIPIENNSHIKSVKSIVKLPLTSVKSVKIIPSEKTILTPSNGLNLRESSQAKKPKILMKNASHKLIF